MGRRVFVHQCPVCNYYIESDLYIGWSGSSPIFLRNHYELAACRDCHNLVSLIVPNTPDQQVETLTQARRNLVITEAEAIAGNTDAQRMLPDLRESLDTFDENVEAITGNCDLCGSHNLHIYNDLNAALLDATRLWLPCPRCEEGRLLLETIGEWT